MILTWRFWVLFSIGIPLAGLLAMSGRAELVIPYDLGLLLLAWITTLIAPKKSQLRLIRKFDPVLSVRTANRIEVSLTNLSPRPISGQIFDLPPSTFAMSPNVESFRLETSGRLTFTYELTPPERGSDYFRGTDLLLDCPLGLAKKKMRLPTSQPIRVYPNVLALREFDLLNQQGRLREIGIRRTRMRGQGSEFESLREYSIDDDFRKIDWKATARRGKLVVKQFEVERNQAVILVVDTSRVMLSEVEGVRKLDHALDSSLMLINAANRAGDQVGLLVFSDTVKQFLPPRKGRNRVGMLIEAMHDLVAEPIEGDVARAITYLDRRWKRRALIVVFTDIDEEVRAEELAAVLGPFARRHRVLLVRVADPTLLSALENRSPERTAIASRAAAGLLNASREEVGRILSRSRIWHLEAEPQDLASTLVNAYFEARSSGQF